MSLCSSLKQPKLGRLTTKPSFPRFCPSKPKLMIRLYHYQTKTSSQFENLRFFEIGPFETFSKLFGLRKRLDIKPDNAPFIMTMVFRKIENRDLRIDQSFAHSLLITSLLVFDILNIVIIGSIKIVLYLYKLLSSPRTVRNQFISFGLTFTVRYFFDRRTFFQYEG